MLLLSHQIDGKLIYFKTGQLSCILFIVLYLKVISDRFCTYLHGITEN